MCIFHNFERKKNTKKTKSNISHLPQYPDIPPLHITTQGVEKLLKNLKINKACGPHKIPNQVLCVWRHVPGAARFVRESQLMDYF